MFLEGMLKTTFSLSISNHHTSAMTVNTILLDFSINPNENIHSKRIENEVLFCLEEKSNFGRGCFQSIVSLKAIPSSNNQLDESNQESKSVLTTESGNKRKASEGFVSIWLGPRNSIVTLRIYELTGLITLNLDYFREANEDPLLTLQDCNELESEWYSKWISSSNPIPKGPIPAVGRGVPLKFYFASSDERILEYDVDRVVFDECSKFQHIQILHSVNFGNMLILDAYQNLAESDLIYTQSLMCHGIENYEGKNVLILGGGDGGLLNEILKENPKMVTMVEIDDMVMKSCREHLRSVCGNSLDNYIGDNHEIIVGDCLEIMRNCIAQGRKFDYVFGDLTDIPVGRKQGSVWEFIGQIIKLSFQILLPNGKYMTHGNGITSVASLTQFEKLFQTFNEASLEFTKTQAMIPSFLEIWIFYQVRRKNTEMGKCSSGNVSNSS